MRRKKQLRIVVLGYFGYRSNQLDGQTVKTRNILDLLQDKCENASIQYFDTELLHHNPLSIFTMLWRVCRCDRLIYVPASNNLIHFAPLLAVLAKLFRFKVIHLVVGGWLAEWLQQHPKSKRAVAKYDVILTETKIDKEKLERLFGFQHVRVFPNFRIDSREDLQLETSSIRTDFRIVFMARIHRMKGLDWMDALASHIEKNYERGSVKIDFYGPINLDDNDYFSEILSRHKSMNYLGVLEPSDIVKTLSKYNVLVLPTHYFTEGFPGSILDAYRSGILVIVTEWLHAKQFVRDGESGFIIPFEHGDQDLCEKVDYLINNPNKLKDLKRQAYAESLRYSPEAGWKILKEYL